MRSRSLRTFLVPLLFASLVVAKNKDKTQLPKLLVSAQYVFVTTYFGESQRTATQYPNHAGRPAGGSGCPEGDRKMGEVQYCSGTGGRRPRHRCAQRTSGRNAGGSAGSRRYAPAFQPTE